MVMRMKVKMMIRKMIMMIMKMIMMKKMKMVMMIMMMIMMMIGWVGTGWKRPLQTGTKLHVLELCKFFYS